jgi:hypothetical protein
MSLRAGLVYKSVTAPPSEVAAKVAVWLRVVPREELPKLDY